MNPYLEVVIAAIIWGSSGVFVKLVNLNPFVISFFRMAIPTLIIAAYFIVIRNNVFRNNNKFILLASFLNAVRMFFYFVGFTHTSIGNAIIILYTWPIFVAVFGSVLLKDKMTRIKVVALLIAFSGIIMIYMNKKISLLNSDFIGMSAILISSCIYSLSVIAFKKVSDNYAKLEITFFQNFLGGFIFLPFIFVFQPFPSLTKIAILTSYAILVGLVGFTLFFAALKKIKASVASNIAYLEIVSAIVFSVIIFGEKISWNMAVGGLMIIFSVLIIQRYCAKDI